MVKDAIIRVVDLSCYYGSLQVLKNVSLEIYRNEILRNYRAG